LICRVCRSGETFDQPLYNPCKCNGSMKHVHQVCLEEWLSHSNSKKCEICKHQFRFSPIYSANTPNRITWPFFLKHIMKKSLRNLKFYTRVAFVTAIWLFLIPYITAITERFFFQFGDFWTFFKAHFPNSTVETEYELIWNLPFNILIQSFLADVFEGQVLSSIAIIVLLLLFCMREYVLIATPIDALGRPAPFVENGQVPAVNRAIRVPAPHIRERVRQRQQVLNELNVAVDEFNVARRNPVPNLNIQDMVLPQNEIMQEEPLIAHTDSDEESHPIYDENLISSPSSSNPRLKTYHPRVLKRRESSASGEEGSSSSSYVGEKNIEKPLIESNGSSSVDHAPPVATSTVDQVQHHITEKDEESIFNFDDDVKDLDDDNSIFHKEGIPVEDDFPEEIFPEEDFPEELLADPEIPPDANEPLPIVEHNEVPILPPIQVQQIRQNLNIDVNVNINQQGLNAEINAQGDINAFLELVGIEGSLFNLFSLFCMAVTFVFFVVGLGGYIPYQLGRILVYAFEDIYSPFIDKVFSAVVVGSDSLLDPLVDFFVNNFLHKTFNFQLRDHVSENLSTNDSIITNTTVAVIETFISDPLNENNLKKKVFRFGFNIFNFDFKKLRSSNSLYLGYLPKSFMYILVGYFTIGILVFLKAKRSGYFNHPYFHTLKRLCIRSCRIVLLANKFCFFLTIELGLFPAFCGVLIDFITLPVFGPSITMSTRWAFFKRAPFICYFLHWICGTICMFQLAGYVATIREIIRPGVMWFIRDPNDPEFQPLNEIMTRTVLVQFKKLLVGTVMYSVLIFGGVGGVVACLKLFEIMFSVLFSSRFNLTALFGITIEKNSGPFKIFPLKWEFNSQPISDMPTDLLILHFIVPFLYKLVKPKLRFKFLMERWFKFTANRLRLTEFLLGEKNMEEEDAENNWVDVDDTESDDELPDLIYPNNNAVAKPKASKVREFEFLRVPNTDRIRVVPGEKILIPMRRGEKLFGRVGETEDEVKERWRIVWVPGYLKLRLMGFVIGHWLYLLSVASVLIIIPLCLGRIFSLYTQKFFEGYSPVFNTNIFNSTDFIEKSATNLTESNFANEIFKNYPGRDDLNLHDIYSYSIGIVLVVAVLYPISKTFQLLKFMTTLVYRMLFNIYHRSKGTSKNENFKGSLKKKFNHEKEIQFNLKDEVSLRVQYLVNFVTVEAFQYIKLDYVSGLVGTKIFFGLLRLSPENSLRRVVNNARTLGLRRFDVKEITFKLFIPVTLVLSFFVLFPFVLFGANLGRVIFGGSAFERPERKQRPPVPLETFSFIIKKKLKDWMEKVKDDEYLGIFLKN
ncbi:hypothetical protein HK099_005707, partial [Clydaea vesicula]